MKTKNFKACIFDFDGVIVDSEKLHAKAKKATLDFFKVKYPEDIFENFKGRADIYLFQHVTQHLTPNKIHPEEMLEYKKGIYKSLFEEIQLIEGIHEFIRFARARFEKLGITTSTTFHDYSLAIQKFQIEKYFDFIITGDDTQKHKPDPEPYLLAAEKVDFDLEYAMVIEDSPNGIRSAKTAGFKKVIGITSSFTEEELVKAGAQHVVQSFSELEETMPY